jgi:hypothetical protein
MEIIIQQHSQATKKIAKKMLKYIEDKKMAWCFDEQGILWSRESLNNLLNTL